MKKNIHKMITEKPSTGSLKEMVVVIVEALLLALIIRTFVIQPFVIPSGSMQPTLLIGDYIFASKFSYGYSRFSFPFSPPLFSGRIFASEPNRGDIVVFRHEDEEGARDYVKRLIGFPGDKIQINDGQLYINGEAVKREKIGETKDIDVISRLPSGRLFDPKVDAAISIYQETLPNGVSYVTLDLFSMGMGDNTPIFEVPLGSYFLMGDNRDNSLDSRFSIGYIPFENFLGRADVIFFSIGGSSSAWQLWRWPSNVRWGRIFSFVNTVKHVPDGQ